MPLTLIFLLGVANFAMHAAVMHSDHPLLGRNRWYLHRLGGRVTLTTEFLLLFAALLLVAEGWRWLVWAYLGYSLLNAVAVWLILTRRV
ncbi:hypothetical protein N0B51_02750 [Tsuneonella sp. YG55]|uniref:Uncharacterized protein n=1 Tax=Tsuneonella litorea TaxID=2976475 RepID=A0A9X3A716_9SPHN|nr:hypothetical protein [Tsuneonella litorea]MCT2557896.1 hypothetical protein [Tsuneonella litorea]